MGSHHYRRSRWLLALLLAAAAASFVFGLAAPAQAFKPAAHFVLLEKVRDTLPQGSTIRLAIEQNMTVANWGANGPDIGYADVRMALDYAPWGDRAHYDRVGSFAAEQLRAALASGDNAKIAWAAGWITHVTGDMAVHGMLVNPECGVYLDGGNHDLHKQLESWADVVAFVYLGGHSESYYDQGPVHPWAAEYFTVLPSGTIRSFVRQQYQTIYETQPDDGDFQDWTENFRDSLLLGTGLLGYSYNDLDDANIGLSTNGRRAKLDSAMNAARDQAVALLTAGASGDYSSFSDRWNLDASSTDGRSIGTLVVTIHTANEALAGTDDTVYFGLRLANGREHEWKLDMAGYNDFEQNDTDDYYLFTSDTTFPPNQVTKVWVRKTTGSFFDDEWKFGDIDIRIDGQLILSTHVGRLMEDAARWEYNANWSTLNRAPVAAGQAITLDEGKPKAITLGATDPEGDPLTFSKVGFPMHGSLSMINGNQITYTPDRGYCGTDSFTFRASDGAHFSNTATVTLQVNPKPGNIEPNDDFETATRLWKDLVRMEYVGHADDRDIFYIDLPAWGGPHNVTVTMDVPLQCDYQMQIALSIPGAFEAISWPGWPMETVDYSDQVSHGVVGNGVRLYVLVAGSNYRDYSLGLPYFLTVSWTSAGSTDPSFPDVGSTYKYQEAIRQMAARGAISGYSDGTFGPNNPVTRAQFAKIVSLTLHLPVSEDLAAPFSDLGPDDSSSLYWHEYIAAIASMGITTGYPDGTFHPSETISLAQLLTMIVRAANDKLRQAPGAYSPPFANFGAPHYDNARRAAYNGLFAGFQDAYSWTGAATRGQCALFLWNLIK